VLQRVGPRPDWTLRGVLEAGKESSRLAEAEISQPACTAVQIAITDLFAAWGIEPSVTVGHSSGEIGAAYAAGRISAPEAILAAFFRGFAVKQAAPVGSMLAVGLGAAAVKGYLPASVAEDITIACENSPSSVTLSGNQASIDATREALDAAQIFARELRTGKAYHSPQMATVAPLYKALFSKAIETLTDVDLTWRRPFADMVSSVTAMEYDEFDVSIEYWCDNLRNRVLFDPALNTLGSSKRYSDVSILLEIGPHSALGGPVKQICAEYGFEHLSYSSSLLRGVDSAMALLKSAGGLWLQGVDVDFDQVNSMTNCGSTSPNGFTKKQGSPRFIPDLPPYQWNYDTKLWAEPRSVAELRQGRHERHDILGRKISGLSANSAVWKNVLRQRDVPWFKDHCLGDAAVFPAAGHLSLAVEALLQQTDLTPETIGGVNFRDIDISKALIVPDSDRGIEVHTRLDTTASPEWFKFSVESIENGVWTIHSAGKIRRCLGVDRSAEKQLDWPYKLNVLHQRVQAQRWYKSFHRVGFQYGPLFQTMKSVRTNGKDRAAAAGVQVRTDCGAMVQESRYMMHPTTIDGCLHVVIASIHKGLHKEMPWGVVPLTIEEMNVNFPDNDNDLEGQCVAWTDRGWDRYFNTHARLLGASGKPLLEIKNLRNIIYDAAIPTTVHSARPREPYGKSSWEPVELSGNRDDSGNDSGAIMLIGEVEASRSFAEALDASILRPDAFESMECDNIVVDDSKGCMLSNLTARSYDAVKSIVCSGKSIVWVTRSVNQGNCITGGMAQGFLRAVRSELVSSRLTLVDIDNELSVPDSCQFIRERLANNATKDSGRDVEFWLRADGSVRVPRITPNDDVNDIFYKDIQYGVERISVSDYYQGTIQGNELLFEALPDSDLIGPQEAEVQVSFIQLMRNDLKGQSDKARIVVGRVTRTGHDLDQALVGQDVIAYTNKAFETKIKTTIFAKVNPGLGAALTTVLPDLCKAIDAVLHTGLAKAGSRVLLLPGERYFIDSVELLAQLFDFRVTRASDAIEEIHAVLSSSETPDIVVASTASQVNAEVWRLLPRGSKLVLSDTTIDEALDARPFIRGATLLACGINALLEKDQKTLQSVLDTGVKLFTGAQELLEKCVAPVLDVEKLLDIQSVRSHPRESQSTVLEIRYGRSEVKVGTTLSISVPRADKIFTVPKSARKASISSRQRIPSGRLLRRPRKKPYYVDV